MNKLNASSSIFYLHDPVYCDYIKEVSSLVKLYNSETPENKLVLEKMIDAAEKKLIQDLKFNFKVLDSDDEAVWRKVFVHDCKESGI